MFLKKLILINWGNIPQLEYEFGPINLFSGGNGSGKTTAADAIQTLMTAAHDTLFTFNPGQDETTQRGRGGKQVRTLASYVLGCDDGSYARLQPTDCYIAGVFYPTAGEDSDPFTSVMAIRAHLDSSSKPAQARQNDLRFFIFPGEQLSIGDFIREYKDGKHLLPLDKFYSVLGKQFERVEQYDKKKAYLRRLYGALRGRRDAVPDREATHAARTFANFMAYKPVKSINDFVAQEVLEKRDLGDAIRSVSELMKTIHAMEQEARQIVERVSSLEQIAQSADLYREQWLQLRIQEYLQARHRQLRLQKTYLAGKHNQQQLRADLQTNEREARIAVERSEQLNQQLVELQAQRLGIDALRSKDQLEQRINGAHRQLSEQGAPLAAQERQWQRNREAAEELLSLLNGTAAELEIPTLGNKALVQCIKQVAREEELPDLHKLLGKDWIDLSALEPLRDRAASSEALHNKLHGLLASADTGETAQGENKSLREQITQQVSRWELKVQQLQKQLHTQENRIQHLQANRVRYPQSVEQALAAIREQCPQAEPRVLCDYVEVLDERWQMAVEGYLGGARFSIIVEPEHEAAAIRIVRNMPGRSNRARVIQGDKARRDAERASVSKDSIVELMEFNHKTAEYYLRASYGSVLQVQDEHELRGTRRGLTADGLASGNYSMWRCDIDDAELVFGQGARARALAAQQQALEQLLAEASQVSDQYQLYRRVAAAARELSGLQLLPVVDAALGAQREWRSAEQALENLDLQDCEQLEQQVAELKVQLQAQQKVQAGLQHDAGKLERDLENTGKQLKALSAELDTLDDALSDREAAVRRIAQITPDYDAEKVLEQADEQAERAGDNFDFGADLEEWQGLLEKYCRQLDRAVMEYNANCAAGDTLAFEPDLGAGHDEVLFKLVCSLHNQVEAMRNRLKNNLLVDRHEQLLGLKKSFNTTFVTHLCHAIYQSINDGKRVLDDLNKELEHHRFGADRERFRFAYSWVPEFREYWNFFKAVIELPNLGEEENLFDAQLSQAHMKVRDKLLNMLLSEDEQVARRELDRISDYRNYRNYEIFKEPEGKEPIALSQYGTGSGGQLETPAYIIRSAAVTSAFRFNEGSSHLQMVLVDEAFSKMDESRSKEVIRYLTETLGLQLLFIMPSSKSGPFMDLISNQFVFSKCPSARPVGQLNTRVYVDRKVCNREKITELWANHRRTIRQQASLDFMEMVEG
ncbi:P-loop containing region of AAA domain-containing protein [Microbulbifer donghaiensis]|uniref:p-loop containing region of AAA domain-containing protein n=1 Tax=Microbulbifer donghaiensis TaxID=494016 RepID=A0A1M5I9Y8_9GAMM|nr:SbcC/MukB-like Walker B domain-containing protein [Microbulbifer donghaiensis]SHG25045.1 P-loop containing region of AAA domain-containing protein [Microbulbifer donghaiensis]